MNTLLPTTQEPEYALLKCQIGHIHFSVCLAKSILSENAIVEKRVVKFHFCKHFISCHIRCKQHTRGTGKKDLHTRRSMDSNNTIWEIIVDCPRMEVLRHLDFSSLSSEERDFILIRIERTKLAVQSHLDGRPQNKGRRAQQTKPPRNG